MLQRVGKTLSKQKELEEKAANIEGDEKGGMISGKRAKTNDG